MRPSSVLLSVFLFVTLTVVLGGVILLARSRGRKDPRVRARLNMLMDVKEEETEEGTKKSVFREEFIRGSPILSLLRMGFPGLSDLGLRLESAGMTISPGRFAQLWVFIILIGSLFGFLFSARGVFIGGLIGGIVPFLILNLKRSRIEKAFEAQFPEALRLLATSLKAGHALPSGIRMLAEELPAPVSSEFEKVSEESALGIGIEEALKNMLLRRNNQDLRFFVTSVMIQRETGGSLSDVLEQLDDLIRERFKIRRQIKALTGAGRMAGMMLGVMPIGMAVVFSIMNPDYMKPLWATSTGRYIALSGFALQGMGYLLIRKIVNIQM